jgi:hypothetical protein
MQFAVAVALTLLAAGLARADDVIKTGKWEYTAELQMPNMPMPKLPPGLQLPPNIQAGPNGMKVTNTHCVTPDEAAPDVRPPGQSNSKCTRDKWERGGGTVHVTAQTPLASGAPPQTVTTHITGHYLGACDAK